MYFVYIIIKLMICIIQFSMQTINLFIKIDVKWLIKLWLIKE